MPTIFEFLPIGAYRSSISGRMLRANPALVRLNGYASESEMIQAVNDIALEWYVDPQRRNTFTQWMERDGSVVDFVSEIYRHKTRERIWIRETAHVVRDANGAAMYYEGTVENITASQKAQLALQASEEQFREITAQVPGMLYRIVFVPGYQGRYTYVSSGCMALFGLSPNDVLANSAVLRNMRHRQDRARVETAVRTAVDNKTALDIEFRVILPDGSVKWIQMVSSCAVADDAGQVRNGILLDITARKTAHAELEQSEARWKLALESTGDGMWDWYVQTGEEYLSKRCKEIYGFGEHELPDREEALDGRTHPRDVPQMLRDRQAHFDGLTPSYANEHRILCKDGSWKWVLTRGMVIARDAHGKPLRMIGTHTDITDRKNAEALVWRQANFDTLTGLPNRRMLRERLGQALRNSSDTGIPLAVLFIDLDDFKEVNDTLGHDVGDRLLVDAAQRIAQCVGPRDTVARMGGDEFTIVIKDASDGVALELQLKNILAMLARGFDLHNEQVFVSASMGVALYPRDASVVEDLFKHADQALYVAKNAGRNRYSFFTPALQEAAQTRLRLAADLRVALANGELALVYQPIMDLHTGAVCKAEVLLRWHHPQRGLVSPAEFIPIAETTGQIIAIGEWVFRQAAQQVLLWRKLYGANFQISVNKSPVQFHQPVVGTAPWVEHLRAMGLPGSAIAVEITEGVLLDATDSVTRQLEDLRRAGMAVSLDDFGTGYSSLTYLQRYAIDYIKIDQSFVRNMREGSTDLALCKALIILAHELGMKVVAEGVETWDQCNWLKAAGCDYGQGFLFSKPVGVQAFEAFCAQQPTLSTTTVVPKHDGVK